MNMYLEAGPTSHKITHPFPKFERECFNDMSVRIRLAFARSTLV